MLISSASNDRVKEIKKLIKSATERKKKQLYVVEGIRMFREIPAQNLDSIFIAQSSVERYAEELRQYPDKEPVIVADAVFRNMSDTGTPQGIMALVRMEQCKLEAFCTVENPFLLIIERLQDPGNMGTIIRTAEGAGATGIVVSSDSVDLYNPKVVRSTMGSIFRVPVYVSEQLSDDMDFLRQNGVTIFGAHLDGDNLYDTEFVGACGFLIGNEGKGLSDEIAGTADKLIKIPMMGQVESLNAAVSTTVIAYEVLRQRKFKKNCHK